MKITYVGPSSEVQIADTGQVAVNGEAIEVDDDIANALLAQGCEINEDGSPGSPVDPHWKKAGTKAKDD